VRKMKMTYSDKLYELGRLSTVWKEGSVLLSATDMTVRLPPQVRIKYVGNHPLKSEFHNKIGAGGQIRYNNNSKLQKLEFTLDYKTNNRNPLQSVFIPGHLEGYIYELTGNLSVLYQETRRLGLEFDFLTEDVARSSDAFVRSAIAASPKEVTELYSLSSGQDISIADVAGLVALVKAGFDEGLTQKLERAIRSPGFFRKIPELLEELGKDTFPIMESLVTVHYDNLDPTDFVRKQIESRIGEYIAQGCSVYNFSTFQEPPMQEKVQQISSLGGDAQTDYDLGSQVRQLMRLIKAAQPGTRFHQEIEIVGVTWWKCVERTRGLLVERGLPAHVNYDYTDLVGDYIVSKDLGITIPIGDRPMPTPSADVVKRYKESIR